MLSAPKGKPAVVSEADPAVTLAVPSIVLLLKNVIVPLVGVMLPEVVTVAVNVTGCPPEDGFAELVTVVVLVRMLTVCVRVGDVLAVILVEPVYAAVIERVPAGKLEVVNTATPEPLSAPVPSCTLPFLNRTDPTGTTPLDEVTVAVKVTDWPPEEGFMELAKAVVVVAASTTCVTAVEVLPRLVAEPLYWAVMV